MSPFQKPLAPLPEDSRMAFYAQHRCQPQWRAFLAALSHELFAHADTEDAARFLRDVGRGMADIAALPAAQGLRELEDVMNRALDQMDWGVTSLRDAGQEIQITHFGAPALLPEDRDGFWPKAVGYLLEGLYDQWLHAQGSADHLRTRLVAGRQPDEFVLRHGR